MPYGTITSTENTFGTVNGALSGTVAGTLSGSVGVPGQQGATGATGAQGPQGEPGEGVPVGGTAGQVLAKIDGTNYNTEWVNVEGDYLPLAGGTMTGNIYFDGTSGQYIGKGSFDTSRGGNYGISLVCSVGYEFNWQAGWLTTTVQGGPTPRPLYLDSLAGTTLRAWDSATDKGTEVSHESIVINSDATYDSELGGWGLGVQQSDDHTKGTTVEFDGLDTYDGASHMQVTPTGITFPDASVQSTAYTGVTGFIPGSGNLELGSYALYSNNGTSAGIVSYDSMVVIAGEESIGQSQYYTSTNNNEFRTKITTFGDNGSGDPVVVSLKQSSLQSIGQSLVFTDFSTGTGTRTASYGFNGITFNDASVQTIAFPGFTGYAPLASPAFTGNPTAPTAALADNDTSIATTAFVQQELASGTANARNLEVYVRNQTGSTIPIGSIVYINGATGNRPTITLAQANNDANSAQTIGFTKTAIANNGFGFVIVRGELEGLNTNSLTEGVQLYLSPTTAGTWTTTKPSAPQHLVYVGIVIRSHPTLGVILVSVQNGYELAEIHDVALASVANLDLLTYESSTDLWKNKSFATLGLAGLNSPTFTGTPSLPTGTTAITQTAGNNTTALATTAFVTTSNPDASTTVKGHVELATDAEVIAGTSTTTAVTPNGLEAEIVSPTVSKYFAPAWGSGTSGAGAEALAVFGNQRVQAPTSAIGYATRVHVISQNTTGANPDNGAVNFSKRIAWGFRVIRYSFGTTDANSVCRVLLGKSGAAGNPTTKCIGISFTGTSVLSLVIHDGTTLRTVATSFTPVHLQSFDCVIISDGAGNVSISVNGTQVATSANGPVGSSATTPDHRIEVENIAVLTNVRMGAYYSFHTISTQA